MLVKTEVTKTIWVGMSQDQVESLLSGIIELRNTAVLDGELQLDQCEAFDDLRQALLNV